MTEQLALRALQQEHLFPFVWGAFGVLHPGEPFLPADYVQAICHALETQHTSRRLIVTVPPRHGKSICTSVCLPAWLLGRDPGLKIIVASYGGDLAAKHARDFRALLSSEWYRSVFPRTRLAPGGNRVEEQVTTAHGGRKAVSLGGAVTGFGADLIIVDDLMKASDASSVVERQRVKDYYEQTLLSRLNSKSEGRIVVIQQRLHEDDLTGYLLETGRFAHLNLPALATQDEAIPIGFGKFLHRRKDDVLCPERESRETLEQLRLDMGAFAFSAQYQQDPTPAGGNRIRWEWFSTFDEAFTRTDFQFVVQSWDTAMTGEPTSDFSVGTIWGFRDDHWHLLDLVRERLDFPDLKRRVGGSAAQWNADMVLIEYAGSGISLVQQLRAEARNPGRFMGVKPRLDKMTRLEAQTARLEARRYRIPRDAPWLAEFRRELLAFPNGKHDDQVDSLVQFLEWSAGRRGAGLVERDPVTGRPSRVNRPQHRFRS